MRTSGHQFRDDVLRKRHWDARVEDRSSLPMH